MSLSERNFDRTSAKFWFCHVKNVELTHKTAILHINGNLYHYAGNNPVKYTDPDGKSAVGVLLFSLTAKYVVDNMPSKEEHYNRNQYQKNETYNRLEDAIANDYDRLGYAEGGEEKAESMDRYHEMGSLPENYPQPSGNNKYVKPDRNNPGASFELVFDEKGDLVTDSTNGGTYNFSDPKGIKGSVNHFIKDMLPYYIWGNSELDKQTTTLANRIKGDYQGAVPDPTPNE